MFKEEEDVDHLKYLLLTPTLSLSLLTIEHLLCGLQPVLGKLDDERNIEWGENEVARMKRCYMKWKKMNDK